MKNLRVLSLLLLSGFLGGCAYSVHNVYVSSFGPFPKRGVGRMVKAETEQFVILGFTGNTDYLDDAYEKLGNECPNGEIVGVKTEYMTNLGFLSWTNKIYMQGLCLQKSSKTADSEAGDDLDQNSLVIF